MAPFTHLIFLAIAFGGFTQVLAKPVSTDSDALVERDDDGPLEVCRTINCVTGNSEPPTEDFRICCSGGHTTASDPNTDSGSTTGDNHSGPSSDSGSTSSGDTPDSSNGLIVTTGHLSNTETDGSVGDGPGSPLTQITATYDEAQSEPAGAGVQFGDVQLVAIGPQDTSNGAAGERVVITRPQGLNLLGPTQATPSGASGGDPPTSGSNGGNPGNGSDGGSGNTGGSSTSGPSNGNQGNGSGGANGDAGNTGSPSTSGANGGNQGTGSGGTAASAGNAGNPSNPPPSGAGSPNAGAGAGNQDNDNQGTNGNGSGSGTGSGSGQQANGSGGSAASGQAANGGGSGSPLICNCVCG